MSYATRRLDRASRFTPDAERLLRDGQCIADGGGRLTRHAQCLTSTIGRDTDAAIDLRRFTIFVRNAQMPNDNLVVIAAMARKGGREDDTLPRLDQHVRRRRHPASRHLAQNLDTVQLALAHQHPSHARTLCLLSKGRV